MSGSKNSPPGKQKPLSPQSLCTVTEANTLSLPPLSGASLAGICSLPNPNPTLSSPQSQLRQSEHTLPCALAPQRSSPLQPWASPPQSGDAPGNVLKHPLLPLPEKAGQVYKVPSFIKKLYTIVNTPANADCITWSLNLRVPSIVVCLSSHPVAFVFETPCMAFHVWSSTTGAIGFALFHVLLCHFGVFFFTLLLLVLFSGNGIEQGTLMCWHRESCPTSSNTATTRVLSDSSTTMGSTKWIPGKVKCFPTGFL